MLAWRIIPLRLRVLLLCIRVVSLLRIRLVRRVLMNERGFGVILRVLVLISLYRTFEIFSIPASCGLIFRTAPNLELTDPSTGKAANEKTNDQADTYDNEKDLHSS